MSSFTDSSFLYYFAVFIGPFVQEDAAVFVAASLFSQNPKRYPLMFLIVLFGLILSDIWKYWIGWLALRNTKVHSLVNKKKITNLEEKVQKYTLTTLFLARFLPLARVPIYIACGLFRIPYGKVLRNDSFNSYDVQHYSFHISLFFSRVLLEKI